MRRRYKMPLIGVAVLIGFLAFSVIYYQYACDPDVGVSSCPGQVMMAELEAESVARAEIRTMIAELAAEVDAARETGLEAEREAKIRTMIAELAAEVDAAVEAEREAEIRTVVAEAVDIRAMYTDVVRYPEKYDSAPVKLTGTAVSTGGGDMRVFVTSGKSVVVDGTRLVDGGRVVERDVVTVYGFMTGLNNINEPVVDALLIQLRGVAPTLEDCMKYDQALPGC